MKNVLISVAQVSLELREMIDEKCIDFCRSGFSGAEK